MYIHVTCAFVLQFASVSTPNGDLLVFGLPGNPVSSLVTFYLVVAPCIRYAASPRYIPCLQWHICDFAHSLRYRVTVSALAQPFKHFQCEILKCFLHANRKLKGYADPHLRRVRVAIKEPSGAALSVVVAAGAAASSRI